MRLKEYQDQFRSLMLASPAALETPSEAIENFFAKDDIALQERLAVYRNNVMGSLSDVVAKTFPILCALVGEDFVRAMAKEFIAASPPSAGCLNLLGQGLDTFIKTFKPAEKMPYLADMATLEIAANNAYYANDDTPLTAEGLADIQPEALGDTVINLRHSAHLIESDYPLMDIRAMCLDPDGAEALDLAAGKVRLLVHRPLFTVTYMQIADDEWNLLKNLESGYTLGQAVEATLAVFPALDLQKFLQKHIESETFQSVSANKG